MQFAKSLRLSCTLILLVCAAANAQQAASSSAAAIVPRLVNFSGKATDGGNAVTGSAGATFAIYSEQSGGSPLWLETQNIQADAKGNYTAQLGAMSAQGLPLDLFASGGARWLGVRINGGEEQARILLLSVPYALKAADAETIGGLPPSAFVLATPPTANAAAASANPGLSASPSVPPPASSDVTTTGGTASAVPLFTTGTNVQNSILTQTGTTAINVGGKLILPASGVATASKGFTSHPLDLVASSFNSSTAAPVTQTFQWQAEQANNNTANPSAILTLLYGSGTTAPAETGLRIGPKGIISFVPGQTFPGGSGTITGVTAGTALTGGGTTGNVTLNVDVNQVPLLASDNFFTGANVFNAVSTPIYAVSSSANSGTIEGVQTASCCNAIGVYGQSDDSSGYGVEGYDSASIGSPIGVYGLTFAPGGSGVYGSNGANTGEPTGVTGITPNCNGCGYGVVGSGGIAGVVGASNTGYAMIAQGNVEQCITCGGWVKGMVYVNGQTSPYSIVRCFNSTLAGSAATTPPCGFTLKDDGRSGEWIVDFGFEVTNRFWSATLAAPNTGINGVPSIAADNPWPGVTLTATQLFAVVYSAQPPNWNFSLVVY